MIKFSEWDFFLEQKWQEHKKGYPFLKNDPVITESSFEMAKQFLGPENVVVPMSTSF